MKEFLMFIWGFSKYLVLLAIMLSAYIQHKRGKRYTKKEIITSILVGLLLMTIVNVFIMFRYI